MFLNKLGYISLLDLADELALEVRETCSALAEERLHEVLLEISRREAEADAPWQGVPF